MSHTAVGMLCMVGDRLEPIPSVCDATVNLYNRFVVRRAWRLETTWATEARGGSD